MRVILALSMLTLVGLTGRAVAQDATAADTMPTVTVRGDGAAQRKPDFARLIVSVSTTAPSLKQAADRQKEKAARALALLQSLKVQGVDVERSDFTLEQTNPDSAPDAPVPPPQFTAATSFTVRVNALDTFDADLSALVDSGLVEISSSSFEIKDPAAALNDARRGAIVAARKSAEAYADAGQFKLLNLEKALDVTPQNFSGLGASALMARAKPASVALVPPAKLSFHASVVATWRIAPR